MLRVGAGGRRTSVSSFGARYAFTQWLATLSK
jgi:hypothetical protein